MDPQLHEQVIGLALENTQQQIAKRLKISKQRVSYHIKTARQKGELIQVPNLFPKMYVIPNKARKCSKVKKSSDGVRGGRKSLNFHKTEISLPILSGRSSDLPSDSLSVMRNWSAKYYYPRTGDPAFLLENVSSFRIHGKSVSFFLVRKAVDRVPGCELEEFERRYKAVSIVKEWLFLKYRIRTGWPTEKQQHIEASMYEYSDEVPKSVKVKVWTGRDAKGILGKIENSKGSVGEYAELDRSQADNPMQLLNAETNGLEYAKELVLMPVTVRKGYVLQEATYKVMLSHSEKLDLIGQSVAPLGVFLRELNSTMIDIRNALSPSSRLT